jgi:hypothetical protein
MNVLKELYAFWVGHGTKILGSITGTISLFVATALSIEGLIPADDMKYWLFANAFLGALIVKRGFTNGPGSSGSPQGGFARPAMLALLLALAIPAAIVLPGCAATNPFEAAQSPPQAALAAFGSYAIVKDQAAKIYVDSATPEEVKAALKKANDATTKPMNSLYDAYMAYLDVKDLLDAGKTTEEKLQIATANLLNWYLTAKPLLDDLQTEIDKVK